MGQKYLSGGALVNDSSWAAESASETSEPTVMIKFEFGLIIYISHIALWTTV